MGFTSLNGLRRTEKSGTVRLEVLSCLILQTLAILVEMTPLTAQSLYTGPWYKLISSCIMRGLIRYCIETFNVMVNLRFNELF